MKKYLMTLSVLMVTLLVVTGCGGKKLVCTTTEDDMDTEATIKFKDDKVNSMVIKMTAEAPSEEEAKAGQTQMDTLFGSTFGSIDGVSYSSDVKGKKLTMTITMDVDKVDEETKASLVSGKNSYDDIKSDLVSKGYTCK